MALQLVGGSLPIGWHWQDKAAQCWHRGPGSIADPTGSLESWPAKQKNPFRLDQQTLLADCMAAWLLVLAQSDRGVCVSVCAGDAGWGKGGASGGQAQGDFG